MNAAGQLRSPQLGAAGSKGGFEGVRYRGTAASVAAPPEVPDMAATSCPRKPVWGGSQPETP